MIFLILIIIITHGGTATNFTSPFQYEKHIEDSGILYRHDTILCVNGTVIYSTQMKLKSDYTHLSNGHTIEITNCTNSKQLELLLQEHNNKETVEIVKITNVEHTLTKESFIGFKLKLLKVYYSLNIKDKVEEDCRFLENTPELTTLFIKNAHVFIQNSLYPKLPPKINLKKLVINNSVISGKLGYCDNLRWLRLAQCILIIPEDWLSNCAVKIMEIENQTLQKENGLGLIIKGIIKQLEALKINKCFLENLDEELKGADQLQVLDLSNNQLHSVLGTTSLPSLLYLDVSHNHFFSSALLASGIERQHNLRALMLDHNPFLNMCDYEGYRTKPYDEFTELHEPLSGRTLRLQYLEYLSITSTATDALCFHNMKLDSLKYLDISNNTIDNLQFLGVPKTNDSLTINVTNNKIRIVPFEKQEYKILTQNVTMIGLNLTVDCECNNQWLWLALVEGSLTTSVICREGGELVDKNESFVHCTKRKCAEGCTCSTFWSTNRTIARCDSLTDLCDLTEEVHEIHAKDNKVRHLNMSCLSGSLEYLDLSGNQISRCENWVPELFSRSLRLSRNPILCDCDNAPCVRLLQDYKDQIEDYTWTTCSDGALVRSVWSEGACGAALWGAVSAAAGAGGLLAAAAATLARRYRREIKVWLYARGLCLCVPEAEIEEFEYDIFLSFAHDDEDVVLDKLLPELDKRYKVCVHFREWKAGEAIPVQIVSSVERSRCTLAILSTSFLQSVWALLEFRTAHMCAINGQSKLLVVIINDGLVEKDCNIDIPAELKAYLSTNTYLKLSDGMFWDKLEYSLPQRKGLNRNLAGNEFLSLDSVDKIICRKIDEESSSFQKDTSFSLETQQSSALSSSDTQTEGLN